LTSDPREPEPSEEDSPNTNLSWFQSEFLKEDLTSPEEHSLSLSTK